MKKIFPNSTVVITNHFDVHQDWEVPIPGFFIVASKRKITSISEFTDIEAQEYIFLIRKLRKGMKEELGIENVCFFQNEDSEHGFHVWVFPRLEWMEDFGKKIESVRPIIQHAKKNMNTKEVHTQVEEYVKNMKKYME